MAHLITNYIEIQNDEIEALRSIYMGDFSEEKIRTGAWNKTIDRTFKIKIKAASGRSDISLSLSVSLPATYPKSFPHLSLTFSDGLSQKIKEEANHVISRKPKVLLGSEMIFEIATALQDILDQDSDDPISKPIANEIIDGEIPNLHQERARQEAEANQRAKDAEEEKLQTQKETEEERQRQLAYMINQEKARISHRRNKQPATADLFEIEELVSGGLRFDQPVHLTDSKGNVDMFHTVHQKIGYKRGPVTRIYTVQPLGSRAEFSPFLALKECHVPTSNNETFMKRHIQELESTLDRFKSLVSHPNVERPLNFNIQRNLATELSNSKGWDVNILTMLKDKGSVRELLDTIGTINIEMIRAWAIQLLEGLDFYHRNGMVHSDIHVGNILLEKAETGNTIVKLSDGGYQYQLHSISCCLNAKCSLHGLDLWSAPEQSESPNGNPTAATDIWDLGVTLLQMIFGLRIRNQQVSPNGFLTSKDVSRSLEDFFHNMLAIDCKKRKSAFDLKRFEFFRTGEAVFREPSSPNVNSENFMTSFAVSSVAHPRRDSVLNPPKPSRYINDFEEIGLLGRGGFGEVVKARHKLENQFYAIKKIRQNSATALNKVLSEIVMLSQLSHPNVVRYFTAWTENDELHWPGGALSSSSNGSVVSIIDENPDDIFTRGSGGLDFIGADPPDIVFGYDSDDEGGESTTIHKLENDKENDEESEVESELWSEQDPQEGSDDETNNNSIPLRRRHSSSHESAIGTTLYIQMQYCERKTLRDVILNGLHSRPDECWRLFRQILHGLVHIHAAAIVHRDLKPENIFIDFQNDARIGDFGLARPGDQTLSKAGKGHDVYASFTKSIGTAFYAAPEVRSAEKGKYNEKADMYSLGIILFEMCFNMETGMERAHILSKIRRENHALPAVFDDPEKSTQGEIILSLINHQSTNRPSSSELLSTGRIPAQPEDELIQAMLRNLRDPTSLLRHDLLAAIFSQGEEDNFDDENLAETKLSSTRLDKMALGKKRLDNSDDEYSEPDKAQILEELTYDLARPEHGPDDVNVERLVRTKLIAIFHHHGALELSAPLLHSYSKFYSNYTKSAFKVLRHDNKMMQAPYDLTLPHARYLATEPNPIRKSFVFGNVWRDSPSGDLPKVLSEVDFNIVSDNEEDHAIHEAEIIKTVDEIIDDFPSLATANLCYHFNHSNILDAILKFCRIDRLKRPAVKEEISRLNFNDWKWAKLKHNLRAPPLNVAATSLEELQRFDFRETFESCILRLRTILPESTKLEKSFDCLKSINHHLGRLNVKRRIYINPLSSFNEKFFRGEFLFQCIYDNKRRDVFAAGGRYDRLVRYFRIDPKIRSRFAVGFSMNWQALCPSMVRYHQKTMAKLELNKSLENGGDGFWVQRRCDVLVDCFDYALLPSSGMEMVSVLWSNGFSAELAIGIDLEDDDIHSLTKENRNNYAWVVLIKNDGTLRVRNTIRNEDTELTKSELPGWLRSSIRDRDRWTGRKDEKLRLVRHMSHQESGSQSSSREADVRVMMSQNKGKKINRKTVVEEAQSQIQELVRSSLDGPIIAAIETKDEILDAIRATVLSDVETWKKLIQSVAPHERHYLGQVQQLLRDMAKDAQPGFRNAFIYNFRSKKCIMYDLGPIS